jgi:hypothetical protein
MAEAARQFHESTGKPFKYLACIPIVHKIAGYDPMQVISVDEPEGTQPVVSDAVAKVADMNALTSTMGRSLPTPVGTKAAKRETSEPSSFAALALANS